MNFWRAAGLNYIQYSNVAARVVRKALKPQLQVDARKREVVSIKFTKWESGKAVAGKN
uniref:ATP synthase subunit epsilon, mitochondrial n=1 Tax=Lepeophtheirus salmonis TaxID=72036 RepID=C1BV39_LEPSM|nr:ATP synthase subunit epsilon, mitochondrial [Lepeophtheirus salmonis]ADD38499.1 ATP synthase subunit epsilon, mitochondrial [Lepeophtheirus salmonis]